MLFSGHVQWTRDWVGAQCPTNQKVFNETHAKRQDDSTTAPLPHSSQLLSIPSFSRCTTRPAGSRCIPTSAIRVFQLLHAVTMVNTHPACFLGCTGATGGTLTQATNQWCTFNLVKPERSTPPISMMLSGRETSYSPPLVQKQTWEVEGLRYG